MKLPALYFSILLSILFHPEVLFSQSFNRLSIPFTINNLELQNPLTGGLNAPQFSVVDLNNDSVEDLYLFDRVGEVHLSFLNTGNMGETSYTFAPQFSNNFPPVTNWVALRDFNADGIVDIFSHAGEEGIDGIKVFRGKYINGKIDFERVTFEQDFNFEVLTYPFSNGLLNQIVALDIDYPDFNDIDGDGDLDILVFVGGNVSFFQNQAVELGLPLDSLRYELADDCWGRFFESATSETITLSPSLDECADGFNTNPLHSGSTLLTFDEDGDEDMEILIGDFVNPFLRRLTNGGTPQTAFMTAQDAMYPAYDVPLFLPFFPASFYLDVNNDGIKDLVVAPNELANVEDHNLTWFYQNTGSSTQPIFELQQTNFLVEEMLDFGTNAYPTLADVTGDGLLDLVVGNFSSYLPNGNKDSRLFLFENIGTATIPEFELIDENWLNFSQFNAETWAFTPTFGDLDNDEDLDLLVGEIFGKLFYAENTAGFGNPMHFPNIEIAWQNINVGQYSTPHIADLNRDGLPDLLIGEQTGNINFLPNQGTLNAPNFHPNPDEIPNDFFFGNINVGIAGRSTPFVLDFGNEFQLLTGNQLGEIRLYNNIENNLEGTFDLITTHFGNLTEGWQTAPIMADINSNGILDLLVGNRRGGLSSFVSNLTVTGMTATQENSALPPIHIYPNPVWKEFYIELNSLNSNPSKILIFNTLGEKIIETNTLENMWKTSVEMWKTGIYYCEVHRGKEVVVMKFVKI